MRMHSSYGIETAHSSEPTKYVSRIISKNTIPAYEPIDSNFCFENIYAAHELYDTVTVPVVSLRRARKNVTKRC